MKTIREWLESLPEPYRSQALENMDNYRRPYAPEAHSSHGNLEEALMAAFLWYDTPQGREYWENVSQDRSLIRIASPTNALSAIHAIALKKGFAAEEIDGVEHWRESADDEHWR